MRGEAVFYWVEMNVIHMGAVIPVVTDCMFPEALLPNAVPVTIQNIRQGFCETDFDGAPAAGRIRVVFRQGPDAMHVVRQNDPGVDMERS